MSTTMTLQTLKETLEGTAAGIRRVTEYQPAGGVGDKIFPPTYEGGKYATEKRLVDNEMVDCVLLDSVQSQANRMEQALLEAWENDLIPLPVISVDFSNSVVSDLGRITTLEAPHRIADAIIRDSLFDGATFRKSEYGKSLDSASLRNATSIFELCPTALIFGMWDSAGPKGGSGAKFPRAMVSEIIGVDATFGVKTSSRIDPLGILREAATIYKAKQGGWTLEEKNAGQDSQGNPVKYGKGGKPSEINLGNVTPTITDGGITIKKAVQTTVISLAGLRRLRFPLKSGIKPSKETDIAAQTVLAALALCAASLSFEQGCDLRSRCLLVPIEAENWEIINRPPEKPLSFSLSAEESIHLLLEAVEYFKKFDLRWHEDEILLNPSDNLVSLIKKSQDLSKEQVEEEL